MNDYSDYPGFRYISVDGMRTIDFAYERQVSAKRDAIDASLERGIMNWLRRPENAQWQAQFVETARMSDMACKAGADKILDNLILEMRFYKGLGIAMDITRWIMDTEHRDLMFIRACNGIQNRLRTKGFKFQEEGEE